jgi:hypothetical protein
MPDANINPIAAFIERWEHSGAAERANYALFLSELCTLLGLPSPDPTSPDNLRNTYVFERAVSRKNPDGSTSTGFIDLYRRGSFVLESKQGTHGLEESDPIGAASAKTGHGKRGSAAFDKALERAFHQARGYITALPAEEGRPPFLIVCDIGHSIDLYAEFTGTGGQYERFPDPVSHRITLQDLHRPEIRERLRTIWLDPHALDPSKIAAKVTRDIAGRLAVLAKSLEADGHEPQVIAGFLQRTLFTMFAEDIGLLPEDGFQTLLAKVKDTPHGFPILISTLWKEMATGTHYSALLFKEIACFSGGLFEDTTALPLSPAQLSMLADAAATDWSAVEPSIFGTLLTRALNPRERHKLGAEFTPRSYVERLIRPTIISPLREEWDAVRVAAATLHEEADQAEIQADQLEATAKVKMLAGASDEAKQLGADASQLRKETKKSRAEALSQVIAFHRYLCGLTVLDPACGTANFLYVTMEHMKRLEAEVLELIAALGGDAGMEMQGFRVRPEHFIGLELNKQAVAIAQLVLWIGYFQWQHKTTGKADTGDRPLLPKDRSIFEQDAVLSYDERVPRRDPDSGAILTVWDGHSTKPHPITGKNVPDESARTTLFDYINPRRAEWPQADYIVGNPPFLGSKLLRESLGDGYVDALHKVWPEVPQATDFVIRWWHMAANLARDGKIVRFGFITTNSFGQTYVRRAIEPHLEGGNPLSIVYAIPDHPWIDSADGAAVRISMTVAEKGQRFGTLDTVVRETPSESGENEVFLTSQTGKIFSNLMIGNDIGSALPLQSNAGLCAVGMKTIGAAFQINLQTANELGLGRVDQIERHIRPYINGRELLNTRSDKFIIDLFGLNEGEVLVNFPEVYQFLLNHAKPDRNQNRNELFRKNWWVIGHPRQVFRAFSAGLTRYAATVETSQHRIFAFLPVDITPDSTIVTFGLQDSFYFGLFSSFVHAFWAFVQGGTLEDRPRYNKTTCFETFPFPALEESAQKQRIRDLGERLDVHRKRQQELHPDLTLTGIYNVLQKIRSGEALNAKDKAVHDQGLISVLKQIHDDLDAAVLEAYGWTDLASATPPADILARGGPDAEALEQAILTRLVALNHARAAEEKRGHVRWLRPDFQAPASSDGHRPTLQSEITLSEDDATTPDTAAPVALLDWPPELPAQVAALRKLLPTVGPDPEALAACFGRKNKKRQDQITSILETLRSLGHIL